jgi:hypothetical protein
LQKDHGLHDAEQIELEDLPGVRGLRAMRVAVNLEAASDETLVFRAAGQSPDGAIPNQE